MFRKHSAPWISCLIDRLLWLERFVVRRLSALDNVLAGRLAGAPLWRVMLRSFSAADETIAIKALLEVGLGEHLDQRADTLSGGQQQRVAIARAIAQQSHIILADEPVASLDPDTAVSILEIAASPQPHVGDCGCLHAATAVACRAVCRSHVDNGCRPFIGSGIANLNVHRSGRYRM